jgi:dihydrofolate synthase/folylpolyglutamate synthase
VDKGFEVCTTDSTREALRQAYKLCDKNDLVCFTGSLYLVAEARELLVGKDNWSLTAVNG